MNEPDDDLLDRQLRAAFEPPPADAFPALARAAMATDAPTPAPIRVWPWFAAAAALLLTLGLWWSQSTSSPQRLDGAQIGSLWAAAYEQVAGGRHASCCDPKSDFCGACEQRFAVKLSVGGMRMGGCYCGPTGGCVAAFVEGESGPVGVFVMPRAQDPRPLLPADSSLRLTRRELGPLVVYGVAKGDVASLDRLALQP